MNPNTAKQFLSQIGARIADPDLNAELCFALGEETAGARFREILESDSARVRPLAALRLAIESHMPAADVINMLATMPAERDEDGAGPSAIRSRAPILAAIRSPGTDSRKGRVA